MESLDRSITLKMVKNFKIGLRALREEALVVYAATRHLTLTGGSHEVSWPEAVVKVVHEREARVETSSHSRTTRS